MPEVLGFFQRITIVEATPIHLHHYPGKAGRGSASLLMIVIWLRAAKHKAFSQTKEANGFQFSLKTEVLPSKIIWKLAESVRAVVNKWEKGHHFEVLVRYDYSHT